MRDAQSGIIKNLSPETFYDTYGSKIFSQFNFYDYIYVGKNDNEFFDFIYKSSRIQKTDKVLDLGCGGGYLTHELSKFNEVNGLTNSQNCINLAKKKYPSCKFIKNDMEDFISKHKYDVILALESICHTKDLYRTLKNCYENLREKGRLYIKDMIYLDDLNQLAARNKAYHCYFYSLCPEYTINNLLNSAKDVGFKTIYIQNLDEISNQEYGESTLFHHEGRGKYRSLFAKEKYHENLAILFQKN